MELKWRLDHSVPLNAEPEFYETQAAADRRAWALVYIAGYKGLICVWNDLAEYVPLEVG